MIATMTKSLPMENFALRALPAIMGTTLVLLAFSAFLESTGKRAKGIAKSVLTMLLVQEAKLKFAHQELGQLTAKDKRNTA